MNYPTTSLPRQFLHIQAVIHRVGFQKSWIHREVAANRFPAPIKIGSAALWDSSAIDAWMADQAWRGHSDT
jgi:prophage regulatory protein